MNKMILNLMKLFMMMILITSNMNFMNKLNNKYMKKNFFNSIECGFNQLNNKHLPLYNNFFIIMIIFLIFDLEFFLMIPLMIMMKNFNWMKFLKLMIMIIFFIYFSMLYEIKINSINWIK